MVFGSDLCFFMLTTHRDKIRIRVVVPGKLQVDLELVHDALDPLAFASDNHRVNTMINLNLLLGH